MINKENILENFDDLAIEKKNGRTIMSLIVFFSLLVIAFVLIWTYAIVSNAGDKIKVVDNNGQYLKTTLEKKEKLFKSLIQNHCANTVYYANSFDRMTVKENQAKTLFLLNSADAYRIFAKYKDNHAYNASLDRGVIYKTELEKIDEISGTQEPFHVRFTSVLTIADNDRPTTKVRILSEGDIVSYTPQYPENVSGFYFKNYNQTYQREENNE